MRIIHHSRYWCRDSEVDLVGIGRAVRTLVDVSAGGRAHDASKIHSESKVH